MSLVSSMFASANGMDAHSDAISTSSDNIANINTAGFKSGYAQISDLVALSPSGSVLSTSQGEGAQMIGINTDFTQGAVQSVGGTTNLAIQGRGFFVVNGNYNGASGNFYTRDGTFHLDQNGYLVNTADLRVQGYSSVDGTISGTLGDLQLLNSVASVPNPTANVSIVANLQADSTSPAAFSVTDPGGTSNFSTSFLVYDSLGEGHNIDMYFRATGTNSYEWHALANGDEITGGTAGTPSQIGFGDLTFDTNGALTSVSNATATASFIGATANQSIVFNFGTSTANGGTGLNGLTCFANDSAIASLEQDGYPEGSLANMSIDSTGAISGNFTNGTIMVIGQLALGDFVNYQGLSRVGGGLFSSTLDSGSAAISIPATGTLGDIVSGALEASNVDLSSEFVRLIALERGFQANTRAIKTASDMLAELENIIR